MVMHLIDAGNSHLYEPELQDLFLARKQIFADGFGWDLPLRNGLDIDQFDDERARYLVAFDTRDNVVMAQRFRPADDKSLLGTLFAHALPEGIRPIDDGKSWEVTRSFCLEFGRKRWNMRRKGACMTAPFEIMLDEGVNRIVGFTDVRMFNFILNMGWPIEILGEAIDYGEGAGFAFEVNVTEAALADIRQRWELPPRAYIYIDRLDAGETVHDAGRRVAIAGGLEELLPREDLSRLRRRIVVADRIAPRVDPAGDNRAAA